MLDVSRSLGVSHGSVYRHFPSKTALRDAVAERWLARVSAPLAMVAAEDGTLLPGSCVDGPASRSDAWPTQL